MFGGRSQAKRELAEAALLLQILAQKAAGLREIRPSTGKPAGIYDLEGSHFSPSTKKVLESSEGSVQGAFRIKNLRAKRERERDELK